METDKEMQNMNKPTIDELFKTPTFGYAYYKIIPDNNGNPKDYQVKDINQQFEKITGFKRSNVIDKKITEVIPNIEQSRPGWIKLCDDIALNGGTKTLEYFSEPLEKWYQIQAYSPKKGYLITLYSDITGEKLIREVSAKFSDFSISNIDYPFIADKAKKLSGAKYVVLNKFDRNGRDFTTIAYSGLHKHLEESISILGFNLIGQKWKYDPVRERKTQNQKTTIFKHLSDLTGTIIPKRLIDIVCRTFNVNETAIIKTQKEGKVIGDFTLIFSENRQLQNREAMEIYADLTGLLLTRIDNESELKISHDRLALAMETGAQGFLDWDIESSQIYFSPGYYEMLGYKNNELSITRDKWKEMIHPEDREVLLKELKRSVENAGSYEVEFRLRCKNGKYKWILGRGKSLQKDTEGKAKRAIGLHVDIDDRKRNDEEIHHLSAIVKQAGEAIIETDTEFNITYMNTAAEQLTGYSADEIKGQNLRVIHSKSFDLEYHANIQNSIATKNTGQLEFVNKKKSGQEYIAATSITPIFNQQDQLTGYAGFLRDVTDQKKALSDANSANKSKSEFLSNMSHELRTPLNGVIGFSELLKYTNLSDVQQQYAETVFSSANSLLEIIDDILDFSKIEAGKLELEPVKTDVLQLLEQSMDIIKFAANKKGLELLLNIDPKMPAYATIDPVRLKQILANLLGNAVKFTEKGDVELTAKFNTENNKTGKYSFSVRDTGIGIEDWQQERLFKAFSQADSSTTRKFGGTGLGLIISDKLAKKMGGKILLNSSPGLGTTFHFSIIAEYQYDETIAEPDLNHIKHCLVIDDNENNLAILKNMLENQSINFTGCDNGFDGLKIIQENNPFDLIIIDYHMPYMNGLDTIGMIREKMHLSVKEIPVILMHSSSDDSTLQEKCNALDIHFLLTKPVKTQELFRYLSKIHTTKSTSIPMNQTSENNNHSDDPIKKQVKILIAEDVPTNMLVAKSLIKQIIPSAEFIEVADGNEAVKMTLLHNPDLIFMDVQMPKMDGNAATRAIRDAEKNTDNHAPVIGLTAGATSIEKEISMNCGMDEFLTKPIIREKLKAILFKYLQ